MSNLDARRSNLTSMVSFQDKSIFDDGHWFIGGSGTVSGGGLSGSVGLSTLNQGTLQGSVSYQRGIAVIKGQAAISKDGIEFSAAPEVSYFEQRIFYAERLG